MNYLDVLLTREMLRMQAKSLKSERLKLEKKVNSQKFLYYYLKLIWKFILRSPTFLYVCRIFCEAIQPGKTRIFDNRYSVFVWELVSYWPVFLHFSFEACRLFLQLLTMFWIFRMIFSSTWSLCCISQSDYVHVLMSQLWHNKKEDKSCSKQHLFGVYLFFRLRICHKLS